MSTFFPYVMFIALCVIKLVNSLCCRIYRGVSFDLWFCSLFFECYFYFMPWNFLQRNVFIVMYELYSSDLCPYFAQYSLQRMPLHSDYHRLGRPAYLLHVPMLSRVNSSAIEKFRTLLTIGAKPRKKGKLCSQNTHVTGNYVQMGK